MFYDLGDWSQAEDYQSRTLQIPQLRHDVERLAWGYADLGVTFHAQKKYEEALTNLHAALRVLENTPGTVQTAVIQMNLAAVYLNMGRLAEALDWSVQAQQLFQQIHDGRRLIMVEINIGIIYLRMGQFEAAEQILRHAEERAELLGHQYMRLNALDQLGIVHLKCDDCDRAIAIFKSALDYLESLPDSPRQDRHRQALARHLHEAQAVMAGEETVPKSS